MPDAIHADLARLVREFPAVGGLPTSMLAFVESGRILCVLISTTIDPPAHHPFFSTD